MYGVAISVVVGSRVGVLVGNMDGRERLELRGRFGVQGVLLSWGLAGLTVSIGSSQEVYSHVSRVMHMESNVSHLVGIELELCSQDRCCDVVDKVRGAHYVITGIAATKEVPARVGIAHIGNRIRSIVDNCPQTGQVVVGR